MAYNDKKIKLDSSLKDINKKFKNEIEDTKNKIYWYIKFSSPLDETSVSNETMCVTRTDGYIFDTKIIYNKKLELIVIEALENYKEDEYYILQVSKDVRDEKKVSLKRQINILFKVKGGEIYEFKELAYNIKVKPPRYRAPTKARVYSFQKNNKKNPLENIKQDKLPFTSIHLNPIIMIIGLLIFGVGYWRNISVASIVGIGISILGLIYIIWQSRKDEFKSNFYYNLSVINFNNGKYKSANKNLQKAIKINPENEYAEYAINKVTFFL